MEKFKRQPEEGKEVARLFGQMDDDENSSIDLDEYMNFWRGVMGQGKSIEVISAQLDRLLDKADFSEMTATAEQISTQTGLDVFQAAEIVLKSI